MRCLESGIRSPSGLLSRPRLSFHRCSNALGSFGQFRSKRGAAKEIPRNVEKGDELRGAKRKLEPAAKSEWPLASKALNPADFPRNRKFIAKSCITLFQELSQLGGCHSIILDGADIMQGSKSFQGRGKRDPLGSKIQSLNGESRLFQFPTPVISVQPSYSRESLIDIPELL